MRKADGCARVRASIHTLLTTFDDEEWRIITLFVNHLDRLLKYTDLFAASCGSITDIKKLDEGYAMTRQMKHYNFPIRNFDGTFYEQVHPFDPSYFLCHGAPNWGPSFHASSLAAHIAATYHHPIPIFEAASATPLCFSKIGSKMMELCAWMNLIDGDQRTQLHGFVHVVSILQVTSHSAPNSIKADIGDLVYNGPRNKASDDSAVLAPLRLGMLRFLLRRLPHRLPRLPHHLFLRRKHRRIFWKFLMDDTILEHMWMTPWSFLVVCLEISSGNVGDHTTGQNWPKGARKKKGTCVVFFCQHVSHAMGFAPTRVYSSTVFTSHPPIWTRWWTDRTRLHEPIGLRAKRNRCWQPAAVWFLSGPGRCRGARVQRISNSVEIRSLRWFTEALNSSNKKKQCHFKSYSPQLSPLSKIFKWGRVRGFSEALLRARDEEMMRWYEMIWDDMRWYEMTWDDMRWWWYEMIWDDDDMRWYELIWDDVRWCEMIWDDMRWYEMKWDDMRWYEMIWDDMRWCEMIWDEMRWNEMIWDDLRWYAMFCDDMRWYEMIWDDVRWWEMMRWGEMRRDEERWGEMMRDEERWGEMRRDDERWWEMMRDDERWWEMMRDDERWWEMVRDDERWWEMVRDDERWWEMRRDEERWGEMRRDEERWGEMMRDDERWWEMMRDEERWWEMRRDDERWWEMMRDDEGWWEMMRDDDEMMRDDEIWWWEMMRYDAENWWDMMLRDDEIWWWEMMRDDDEIWWGDMMRYDEMMWWDMMRWCDEIWWDDVMRYDEMMWWYMVWCGCEIWCDVVMRFDVMWWDLMWCDEIWCDVMRYDVMGWCDEMMWWDDVMRWCDDEMMGWWDDEMMRC